MAIRVQTYNTGPRRLGVGGIDAGAPRGGVGRVTGTASDNVWSEILDAGKKLTGVAIQEYVKDETARVNESLLAMQKELSEERNRYMTENKGQDAIGAGQHFARFAQAASQKYLQNGGFSGRFEEMFRRQAAGAALHFTEQGQNYGVQQRDIWQKSVWDSSVATAMDGVSSDWNNDEYAAFQQQNLFDQIDVRFPGQDNRARKQEVARSIDRARVSGAIASQDFNGAENLMGTLSGRNLSANNFGNVKNSKGGYNAYATRQDGLMGVGERILRYSNAPDRGWHAQTIREMVNIYAPASDNNNPEKYAQFLADRIGVGPNDKVDFRDPQILAGLIKNMPVMEHGNKAKISDEEAMGAARSLLAGNKPKITGEAPGKGGLGGLSAADRATYRKQIDAGIYSRFNDLLGSGDYTQAEQWMKQHRSAVRDPAVRAAMDAKAVSLSAMRDIQETAGMPLLSRQEELYKRADRMPAGARRSEYLQLVGSELTYQKKKEDAEDGKLMVDAINFGTRNGWSAVQWEQNLAKMQASGVRPAVVTGIRKYLNGGEKKLSAARKQEQERAVANMKREYDQYFAQYGVVSPDTEKLDRLFAEGKFTVEQYNELVEYRQRGGAYRNLNQSSLDSVYKKVTGNKSGCPQSMVKAAWARFGKEQGRVVTDDELERWMAQTYSARAITSYGTLWDSTTSLSDAMAEGKTVLGVRVPEGALPRVRAFMRSKGADEADLNDTHKLEQTWGRMLTGEL